PCPIASGYRDQIRVYGMLHNVARIKLVSIAFERKNHCRLERTNRARGPVRREVQVRKLLRFSREKTRGCGLRSGEHRAAPGGKIALDQPDFLTRLRKCGKIRAGPELFSRR